MPTGGTIQPEKNHKRRALRRPAWNVGHPGAADEMGVGEPPHTLERKQSGNRMAQQKTNPKLEQALTRGDLAIRQANSARATALLRALGKMIIDASATIGVEAFTLISDGDRIYDPADGLWPQELLVSLDGPVEESDPDEVRTVRLIADDPGTLFRVEWQRADGKIGRQEGGPFATVAFISDVDIPWTDDED
jgi:hypothetical protein